MNPVNGLILVMLGVLALYLLWWPNSPLFKSRTVTTRQDFNSPANAQQPTANPPGRTGDADSGYSGEVTAPTDNTVGPAEPGDGYSYDANGNLTQNGESTGVYNPGAVG